MIQAQNLEEIAISKLASICKNEGVKLVNTDIFSLLGRSYSPLNPLRSFDILAERKNPILRFLLGQYELIGYIVDFRVPLPIYVENEI